MKLNKKALKKKLIIKADGKKLAAKCFKAKSASVLEIGFCGKAANHIAIQFKSGSLKGSKSLKKSSFKIVASGTDNKSVSQTVKLGKKSSVKSIAMP